MIYKYKLHWSAKFKKEYKRAEKRNYNLELIDNVIKMLAQDIALPEIYKDHELTGNWIGHRECHIQNDWLLIYKKIEDILVLELTRTGTHSDLFSK